MAEFRATAAVLSAGGATDIIPATAVAAGYQLAITDLHLSVETGGGVLSVQRAGVPLIIISSLSGPIFIDRTYRTPIVVDALAGATTFRVQVLAAPVGNRAKALVSGQLSRYPNITVAGNGFINAVTGGGATDTLIADYTVPAMHTFYITDIDLSGDRNLSYELYIGGALAAVWELLAPGYLGLTLKTPLVATAGQVVRTLVRYYGAGGAAAVAGFWNGQLR